MEPNKFRESRVKINQMCEKINEFIAQNDLEASNEYFQEITSQLDKLTPKAEGEIQERSVKNLGIRLKSVSTLIAKIKPKKIRAKRKGPVTPDFDWDEKHVGELSPVFLKKVFTNMGEDKESTVCFGTTGKGVRPSYRIDFGNQDTGSFSGSSHKQLKKSLSSDANKVSKPFAYDLISTILKGK